MDQMVTQAEVRTGTLHGTDGQTQNCTAYFRMGICRADTDVFPPINRCLA